MESRKNALRSEPFRLLFPLGYFCLVFGLGVWSVDLLGASSEPIRLHATLVGNGFLFCFSLGILFTEVPALLRTRSLGMAQFLLLLITLAAMIGAALGQNVFYAQAFHFLSMANLAWFLAVRLRTSAAKGHPGPALAFAAALFSLAGTGLFLLGEASAVFRGFGSWGADLSLQGYFLLFSVACLRWKREERAGGHAADGAWFGIALATLLISLGLEAVSGHSPYQDGYLRLAYGLRAGWVAYALAKPGRIYGLLEGQRFPGGLVRAGLLFTFAAYAMTVFRPSGVSLYNHIAFLAGFAWIALTAATGLISTRLRQAPRKSALRILGAGAASLGAAALLRVSAGQVHAGRGILLGAAAVLALAPLFLWAIAYFPLLADPDSRIPLAAEPPTLDPAGKSVS